jgi:alkylation response protein AidB-like acyl-CoA dehydrogenase
MTPIDDPEWQQRLAEYKAAIVAFEEASKALNARAQERSAPTEEEWAAEEIARARLVLARRALWPVDPDATD